MVSFSILSFGADFSCDGWDLKGTYFQPDHKDLRYWVPKDVFDRVVTSVDSVEDLGKNEFIAIVTLDNQVPNVEGAAKVRINGKSYCLSADIDPKTTVKYYELTNKLALRWVDDKKVFDAQSLKDQMLLLSLRKR
jgi:hypothetical protein